jgi:hypothetical protein
MSAINLKEPTAARRRVFFFVYDLDGLPKTGIAAALTGTQIQWSKNGAAFANAAGSVTEIGLGAYYYTATTGELDTLGFATFVALAQAGSSQQATSDVEVKKPDGLHNIPNSMLDNFTYNANKLPTSCRQRVFADATALAAAVPGHADGADGEIERHTITGVDGGLGLPSSVRYARTFP